MRKKDFLEGHSRARFVLLLLLLLLFLLLLFLLLQECGKALGRSGGQAREIVTGNV